VLAGSQVKVAVDGGGSLAQLINLTADSTGKVAPTLMDLPVTDPSGAVLLDVRWRQAPGDATTNATAIEYGLIAALIAVA
jgi:hypothetical protein